MSLIEQLFKTVFDGNSEPVVSLGNEIYWFIKNIVKKIKKKKYN